jgi:glycosyltransferase involved in cell wall biosynthesis
LAGEQILGSHEETRPMLQHRYMLLTHIPSYVACDGSVWLERLWHRDLVAHLRYLKRLTLVSPGKEKRDQRDLLRVDIPVGVEFRFAPLPPQNSWVGALLRFPRTFIAIASEVFDADIVHAGVSGWPYPLGWVANPLALLLRRKLIIVIESASWRLNNSRKASLQNIVRAALTERLARWIVNRADLGIFTHQGYRDSLMTHARGAALITPAVWIDEADVVSSDSACRAWNLKSERLRVLFAGRLAHDKGISVLADAARILESRGIHIDLDIIGEGALRTDCMLLSGTLRTARVKLLEPVPYGPQFFELVRSYHAVVVPSLSDEQPRIVSDAYSQAVPVIASDTDGLRSNVISGVTGVLVPRGDAVALANTLASYADAPAALRELGMHALAVAHRFTHLGMHDTRWQMLLDRFGSARDFEPRSVRPAASNDDHR